MKIIGHRGASGLAPDNTILAFKKALDLGVDQIELDVQVSQDQVAIVHHDPHITDASGGTIQIKNSVLHELQQHKPELATLEEALVFINHQVPTIIEIKPDVVSIKPIIAILQTCLTHGWHTDDLYVASFSQQILRNIHKKMPGIRLIVNERWSGVRAVRHARQLDTRYITMNQRWLWRGFISAMKQRNFKLSAYTLNDPVKARRWESYGLYGVVTDFPERFIHSTH